jgi:hypothetical protein
VFTATFIVVWSRKRIPFMTPLSLPLLRSRRLASVAWLALAAGACGVFAPLALAQTPPPASAGAAAPAFQGVDRLIGAGLAIVQAVDERRIVAVWEGASPQLRNSVPRDTFVQNLTQIRRNAGALRTREWRSAERLNIRGMANVPDGLYVNVVFDAEYAAIPQARDLVTFRLDADGAWRLAGYVINAAPSAAPAGR